MEKHTQTRITWDLYGILVTLKYEYDSMETDQDFQDYAKEQIEKFFPKAIEYMADEEKDKYMFEDEFDYEDTIDL